MHVASILQSVDLNKCKHLRDFGRGFYTQHGHDLRFFGPVSL
jgi:hypothetical protein